MEKQNLWVEENYVNATERYGCGDSGVFETAYASLGQLFRAMQQEHGRCVSKVYIDKKNGDLTEARQVGWVFQKRAKYDDCEETFSQEVWVTVYTKEPIRHVSVEAEHPF